MKNHFKRILSLMLVVIMLVPMISATGLTVSAATYSGTCGDNLTWNLDTATGVLKIDGTGNMYDYLEEYYNSSWRTTAPWKTYISYIKSVVISDSVTSIGDYAFYKCTSLTSVTIPNSVTNIGSYAFYSCASLTSVYITDIASWCGIDFGDSYANPLYYAENLYLNNELITNLVIPDSVTSIGNLAFKYCDSLTSVTIPDSVKSIGSSAFSSCTSLTSVYITDIASWCGIDFGNSYANPLYYAENFYLNNELVTALVIPDTVTSIGDSAFYWCDSLTSVTIGNSVTSIGESAFADCTSLTSVTIPDSVKNISDYAFYKCTSLTSVTIPDSVTSIGSSAFYYTAYYDISSNWTNNVLYIGNHLIKAKESISGAYSIKDGTLTIAGTAFRDCTSLTSVTIPDSVTSIGDYAFQYCDSLTSVAIPDSVTSIGEGAFAYCTSLTSVTIPDSVTSISDYAFYYCGSLTVRCYENSYAHTYAKNNGFKYELICNHIFTNYISDNNATCTEDGTKTAYCDLGCGTTDTIILEGTALGHTWSEWMTVTEPTYTEDGLQIRYCTVCLFGEEEAIPKLDPPFDENRPVITVDNFTVTITDAENIKDMRYAPGVYSTTTEIRNAEGNVALSESLVVRNTVDGSFVYTMPNGGMYSIWIRMKDGTNYILPLDVTKVTASVSTYGVKITVHDIFDIKDIHIAKGEYQTYREIKDNGYIVALSATKIGNRHDYTYTVYEPGVHTVLVRYNDGRTALFHEELTVDEPVFTVNGLQVTVSNIPDVKVIRTAYGEYTTPGDTKRAPGARNFSGKADIKGADEYMLQYRENGVVTVVVEYNNGYIEIFHHEIQKKTATMVQTKSVVMFKDLDDFVMIRYAVGEYSTSAEIKRAKGSKYLKPADLTGEYAIVSGLAKGTYTFCVQFDDESYNYFTVTVK